MLNSMQGIYTALLTPFDEKGRINEKALRDLVEYNIAKGVTGFYICGSTAECFFLSTDERKAILEIVASQSAKRCKLFAHIGHIDELTALDLATHAEKIGVDAVSSVAPFYYNFNFEEIKRYYFDIADAVSIPVIIYNFPAFSKVSLSEDNLAEFLADSRFIALKHTSSDFFLLERLVKRFPNKLYFNGYDEMFMSGLAAGACGAIGSTFNFMADKFVAVHRLFRENRIQEAQEIQHKANNIISALCKVGVMSGEKAILNMMGFDFGTARKPFRTLTADDKEYLKRVWLNNR